MRLALLCSIALEADLAIASVCKPRQSTDSPLSVVTSSTVPYISSATSTELETATTGLGSPDTTTEATSTATELSSELEIATTSDISSDTTATSDVAITTTASTDLSASTATLTSEGETTTEPSSTYTEETTTALSETTTTVAAPIETSFQVFANGKGLLMGQLIDTWDNVGFLRHHTPILDLTIEPTTSFVHTNNFYLCAKYNTEPYHSASIGLCDVFQRNIAEYGFVTCEKTVDHSFMCSVPAVTCGYNLETLYTECRSLDGAFSQFYLEQQGFTFALLLGSKDHNPPGDLITSVDLQTT